MISATHGINLSAIFARSIENNKGTSNVSLRDFMYNKETNELPKPEINPSAVTSTHESTFSSTPIHHKKWKSTKYSVEILTDLGTSDTTQCDSPIPNMPPLIDSFEISTISSSKSNLSDSNTSINFEHITTSNVANETMTPSLSLLKSSLSTTNQVSTTKSNSEMGKQIVRKILYQWFHLLLLIVNQILQCQNRTNFGENIWRYG